MARSHHVGKKSVRLDERIRQAVARRGVAHLATADLRNRPHVVPICFVMTRAKLYSVIDRKPKRVSPLRLRRVRNLMENPQVAVVVDKYSDDWKQLGWVLLEGTARVLQSGPEHTIALRLLRAKYPQYRRMALENRPVIVVDIERTKRWGRFDITTAGKRKAVPAAEVMDVTRAR